MHGSGRSRRLVMGLAGLLVVLLVVGLSGLAVRVGSPPELTPRQERLASPPLLEGSRSQPPPPPLLLRSRETETLPSAAASASAATAVRETTPAVTMLPTLSPPHAPSATTQGTAAASTGTQPPPATTTAGIVPTRAAASDAAAPEFALYRIIGNDLPPRHAVGQTRANLRFLLTEEPDLPGCRKIFIVNRISNSTEHEQLLELLKEHRAEVIDLPFRLEEYARAEFDLQLLPQPDFLRRCYRNLLENKTLVGSFGRSETRLLAEEFIYRSKNMYAMNNNGARNAALAHGQQLGAQWILPFDGNCYFTSEAWSDFVEAARAAVNSADGKYLIVPMIRSLSKTLQSEALKASKARSEPQIVFRRDARESFDETKFYGRRPKVDLLWRLGVPGPWDGYGAGGPWEDRDITLSPEAGRFTWSSYVVRLFSGNAKGEKEGRNGANRRYVVRRKAIVSYLDKMDQRVLAAAEASPDSPVHRLLGELARSAGAGTTAGTDPKERYCSRRLALGKEEAGKLTSTGRIRLLTCRVHALHSRLVAGSTAAGAADGGIHTADGGLVALVKQSLADVLALAEISSNSRAAKYANCRPHPLSDFPDLHHAADAIRLLGGVVDQLDAGEGGEQLQALAAMVAQARDWAGIWLRSLDRLACHQLLSGVYHLEGLELAMVELNELALARLARSSARISRVHRTLKERMPADIGFPRTGLAQRVTAASMTGTMFPKLSMSHPCAEGVGGGDADGLSARGAVSMAGEMCCPRRSAELLAWLWMANSLAPPGQPVYTYAAFGTSLREAAWQHLEACEAPVKAARREAAAWVLSLWQLMLRLESDPESITVPAAVKAAESSNMGAMRLLGGLESHVGMHPLLASLWQPSQMQPNFQ